MSISLKSILALYRIADLPNRHALLGAFMGSTFLLSLLELAGIASIGALLVQLFSDQENISFYVFEFESRASASLFILSIWTVRAVLVVFLNRFNHAFIQRIKSAIQVRQCDVAFSSKSRSEQIEAGRLFTSLTNEVQMLTGQVFIPLSLALAEIMLVVLFLVVSLIAMPKGILLAGGIVITGYLLTHKIISPISSLLGKKRLQAEKNWTEKVVNMFSLRREAEVYGVTEKIKEELSEQISLSNTLSGKFLSIAPLNRAALETTGVVAILGLLRLADYLDATNEAVMFIILALVRMLPSATRILAAVQSCRFASPVIEKQLAYLRQSPSHQIFESENQIQVNDSQITYKFRKGVQPASIVLALSTPGLVIITGESGVGKTTMLDDLVDFLVSKRASGVCYFSEICYASQNNLVIEKNIHENLAFYRDLGELKITKGINTLKNWGISPGHFALDRRVTDFSGGQKKRVAVARALNCDDAVVILDEPTSGLDHAISEKVIASIHDEAQKNLVIVVTHDQNLIESANNVYNLEKESKYD